MFKKGDLTATQIAIAVFAILGFVIVLLFLLGVLDLSGQTSEEICRLSILERATAPDALKRLAPIKCTTDKICLSKGDDCPQFLGETGVVKVNLPNNENSAADIIESVSANAMYNCWSITGKGRLSLFSGGESDPASNLISNIFTVDEIHPKCIICSRIALSPNLRNETLILQQVNVNEYLKNTQVPGTTQTYLQTFTDRQVNSYPLEFSQQFQNQQKNTNEIAITFMQILGEKGSAGEAALQKGSNTGIAIGTTLLTPLGRTLGFLPSLGIASAGSIISAGQAYFQTKENQATSTVYCGKLTSAESAQYGCSIIAPLDWQNSSAINNFCNGGIEGSISQNSNSIIGGGGSFGGSSFG